MVWPSGVVMTLESGDCVAFAPGCRWISTADAVGQCSTDSRKQL